MGAQIVKAGGRSASRSCSSAADWLGDDDWQWCGGGSEKKEIEVPGSPGASTLSEPTYLTRKKEGEPYKCVGPGLFFVEVHEERKSTVQKSAIAEELNALQKEEEVATEDYQPYRTKVDKAEVGQERSTAEGTDITKTE